MAGLLLALFAAGSQTSALGASPSPGVTPGMAPVVTPAGAASGSRLSRYKERRLAEVGPYDERRRWQTYLAIGEVFERLWIRPASRRILAQGESRTLKRTIFQLEDRDKDGRAEMYAYLPRGKKGRTQDFGAYFDLNGDGRPDWIIFYGGVLFTKKMKVFYWHQHGIDTNGDGRFDVLVRGGIDMDHDGFPEEGATVWVYDSNHDGLVDRAEHIVNGRVTPIKAQRGFLPLRWIMNPELSKQPRVGGEVPTKLFQMIAKDIAAVSRK